MRYNILIAYLLFASLFLMEAQVSKKYGVVNLKGEVVLPLIYDEITPFENGYACTMRRERYGVIDSLGREVLECKYHDINSIMPDRVVAMLNGRYGIIDFDGNQIIPFDQKNIILLPNGFALAYKSVTCGVYDNKGIITVPFSNAILIPFSGNRNLLISTNPITQHNKVIDCFNKELTAFTNRPVRDLGNGYLGVALQEKDTYQILDINGREINPSARIEQNQIFVGDHLRYLSNGKLGLMNVKGEQILSPVYKRIFDFKDGYVKVLQDSTRFGDNQYGIVDINGREIVRCMYDGLGNVSDGRIMAFAAQKYGYLDKEGRVIIPFDFDSGDDFQDRMAVVAKGRYYGVIDAYGRTVLPFEYNQIRYLGNGLFTVLQSGKWKILDKSKQEIGSGGYNSVGNMFAGKYIAVSINRKWAVIDLSGKLILPMDYSSVKDFSTGVFVVSR